MSEQNRNEKVISDLKVLSLLSPGKTLSPSTMTIIDHKSWSSSFWRTYAGENRQDTLSTIKSILTESISILDVTPSYDIFICIESALGGLASLKDTYAGDYYLIAEIDRVIETTKLRLNVINKFNAGLSTNSQSPTLEQCVEEIVRTELLGDYEYDTIAQNTGISDTMNAQFRAADQKIFTNKNSTSEVPDICGQNITNNTSNISEMVATSDRTNDTEGANVTVNDSVKINNPKNGDIQSDFSSPRLVNSDFTKYGYIETNRVIPCSFIKSQAIPEVTSEVIPEPTPEVVPEPTLEVIPEPTPEVVPEPTPEVVPEPTLEVKCCVIPCVFGNSEPKQKSNNGIDDSEISKSQEEKEMKILRSTQCTSGHNEKDCDSPDKKKFPLLHNTTHNRSYSVEILPWSATFAQQLISYQNTEISQWEPIPPRETPNCPFPLSNMSIISVKDCQGMDSIFFRNDCPQIINRTDPLFSSQLLSNGGLIRSGWNIKKTDGHVQRINDYKE